MYVAASMELRAGSVHSMKWQTGIRILVCRYVQARPPALNGSRSPLTILPILSARTLGGRFRPEFAPARPMRKVSSRASDSSTPSLRMCVASVPPWQPQLSEQSDSWRLINIPGVKSETRKLHGAIAHRVFGNCLHGFELSSGVAGLLSFPMTMRRTSPAPDDL